MEEATYVKGGGKQEEESAKSPPKSEDAKMSPVPPTGEDADLLEFTSATEEGSSSAWELVPEKRISRKKGVNSDSELDHLVKKLVQEEAEQTKLTSLKAAAITSSSGASSTSVIDVTTPIPEDAAAETAEDEGTKAEGEAADKPVVTSDSNWEPDFSFEDAPPAPSKESLTSGMGRKNLISTVDNPEDADSEMQDVEPPVAHLGVSKRKERSTSQGSAKKRAISLRSPRAAGPKSKSPSVQKPVNKIPRASSPLSAKAVGKFMAKPPPKAITPIVPLDKAAAAKPPPKAITPIIPLDKAAPAKQPASVTAKPPPSKEAWKDWQAAKAKVAERKQQENLAQPKSPPLFAVDWSRFASKEAFLAKTGEVYELDPNSAEGHNHHVSSYYYVSTDWGVSHPQSCCSIMLKSDSRQSHCWTCVHCRPSHPEWADHKTVGEGMIHWWRHRCHPACWVWSDKATALGVTTSDACKAVLGIDLADQPLPLGGAFHMLPHALPSHPRGLDKRLFRHPYSKTLTPSNHPSEVGLPWNAHLEQLAKAPEVEVASWGWEQFFASVLEGNSDVLAFLIHPFASLNDYINSRHKWHAQAITSPGRKEARDHLTDVEQHSFVLILLKVLATKGESMLMPQSQS